ncbi:putative receptor-like serine/threonine-protein kinase [Quercus suber]|uniref:Receptor-like serine/threonine-protein kinase n=1 Tax=Quercus suber TaxID=58331 RepID=A0AAW0L6G8_QUESU
MIPSAPSKILIGLSLDSDDSKEALSWAIRVLAHPNDTIVAIHILVGDEKKKHELAKKKQSKFRQAKAYVISVLGEFAQTCQSKQVNLEARVGFSSSVGKGLIEEVKSSSANILLLRGSRNSTNRYCFKHAPDSCTLVSIGKCGRAQQYLDTYSPNSEESCQSSLRWSKGNIHQNPVFLDNKKDNHSPTTILDELRGESYSTEDDTSSSGDTSNTESPPLTSKFKIQSKTRKPQLSPYKLIASFFGSPLRKRNVSLSNKEMKQPLIKCFSFEEISNATNNFHQDYIVGQGGYSEVYRGDLSDGKTIAVKRLAKDNKDAKKEKEFLTELGIIGHVSHPNTADLLGCCFENGLYLIFNFSQNGNLSTALHGKKGLYFSFQFQYMHIITDFGLAKWLPNKWTHHAVIPIEGTFGYLAPEYFMHGIVDEKIDVFAFGVLILEIITGRRPVDSSMQNILLWSGDLAQLADPKMKGKYNVEQLHSVVLTASYCVRQSSVWRPSMSEVLELLTSGHDSGVAKSWRIPKFTSDELDDYSMVFGYDVPSDISLEDYL